MVDDKADEMGPQADLDRPKRAAPTLDLDAIEISDETQHADAAGAAEKPRRARSWPLAAVMSSAIVAAMVGAAAAGSVPDQPASGAARRRRQDTLRRGRAAQCGAP